MELNVLAELERLEVKFEPAGDNKVKCCCPFHDDSSPSCVVDLKYKNFRCWSSNCNETGDFVSFIARILKLNRKTVELELQQRYGYTKEKTIDASRVEEWHAQLKDAPFFIDELKARGLTEDLIRLRRIGFDGKRVTIPVQGKSGLYIGVRRYLPGAPGSEKFRNLKGFSSLNIYPIEQLKFDKIVLTGGECKAIVAAKQLNPHGIGAICITGGEGAIEVEHIKDLSGKSKVWVCLDIDAAGRKATKKLCNQLHSFVKWVAPVYLPLSDEKYPKGDINDFIARERGDLLPLLNAVEEFKPELSTTDYGSDEEPEPMELSEAIHAKQVAKRISINSVVAAIDTAPYLIPKKVDISCTRTEKYCAICPVFLHNKTSHEIPAESPAILDMVAAHKMGQTDALKQAIGIPVICRVCTFDAKEHYNVEDARISPPLDVSNRATDRVMQPALCIGDRLELNESYKFVGRLHPHPKTQQAVLLVSKYQQTQDALSNYKCDDMAELAAFWPNEFSIEGIQEKLDSVYSDLEANVTRIYERREIHLAADLTYHSPLFFRFDGKIVKGWVESLILGDSSQGKSETVLNLQRHYQLGEKVECKNATVAGLLGGLQQIAGRWFVSWGIIPTHDKRLVILEELKGNNLVLGKLTDMRSSGIAEIPKIEKRRTNARTRLIVLSNPLSDLKLSQYSFGIQAVKELISGLEDIRRFDLVCLVSGEKIDERKINLLQASRPKLEHTYTSQMCRKLILWGWTRSADQVIFAEGTTELILEKANYFCGKFSENIPICDKGSMRLKLARLAASLAVRTFSCSDDFECVMVYPAHVEYIANYLDEMYSANSFGYLDYTQAIKLISELEDEPAIIARIRSCPYPPDLCKSMIAAVSVDNQDLQDWCGYERSDAQDLLSFFVRKRALVRKGKAYYKTPPFINLLKSVLSSGVVDLPRHIQEVQKEY